MPVRLPRLAYLAIGRFGRNRVVRRLHPALYRRFHGAAFLGTALGCRMVIVHAVGARTGRRRPVPLFAFPVGSGSGLAVVASNGGLAHPPAWYHNLVAHPDVDVEDGPLVRRRRARTVVDPDERSAIWAAVTAGYAGYDAYQATWSTPIPLVVLEDPAG